MENRYLPVSIRSSSTFWFYSALKYKPIFLQHSFRLGGSSQPAPCIFEQKLCNDVISCEELLFAFLTLQTFSKII